MSVTYDIHIHTKDDHKGLKPQSDRTYTFMNNTKTDKVLSDQTHIQQLTGKKKKEKKDVKEILPLYNTEDKNNTLLISRFKLFLI